MGVECKSLTRTSRDLPAPFHRMPASRWRRLACLIGINLLVFSTCLVVAEIAFRLFLGPRYWIHTDRLVIGSGHTEAGKKWWPDTSYHVDSSEFHVIFCTNAQGYRARPEPAPLGRPFRVAFVGDSFTEGMQVAYESTFCARLEERLNQSDNSRTFVCENDGVSATDLLEYWHRITHDILAANPPDAVVLCIYPGNDFQGVMPSRAFDDDDRPYRDYFTKPTWGLHLIAWINLHSKFGSYLQRAIFSIGNGRSMVSSQAQKNWWNDPEVAAQAHDEPAVRRSRALLRAIDAECRRVGTKLCVLVVGPVATYAGKDQHSPLERILASWGIDVPVIDVAIQAVSQPDYQSMTFPIDGHLNESGHAYIARQAAPRLEAILKENVLTEARADLNR
jgi:hypothetical protein